MATAGLWLVARPTREVASRWKLAKIGLNGAFRPGHDCTPRLPVSDGIGADIIIVVTIANPRYRSAPVGRV